MHIYEQLLGMYGPQGWWPVTPPGSVYPRYGEPVRTVQQQLEIALGAILTQNTSWNNVLKVLVSLNSQGLIDRQKLGAMTCEELAPLIRSAGYFNQKARKIKAFLEYDGPPERDALLRIWGIGPETVDSILLYAFSLPSFVVDAYTRRYFSALGVIQGTEPYEEIRAIFEQAVAEAVPPGGAGDKARRAPLAAIYGEYHALIVAHAKRYYSKKPFGMNDPTRQDQGHG